MRCDRLADLGPRAAYQVEDPVRDAGLGDQVGEDVGAERGDLARLDDDRAPGGERGSRLQADRPQRPVPRRDRADDADRFAARHEILDGLLPGHLADGVGEVSQIAYGHGRLRIGGEGDRLPDLADDQPGDLLTAALDQVGQPAKGVGPLTGRRLRPRGEGVGGRARG